MSLFRNLVVAINFTPRTELTLESLGCMSLEGDPILLHRSQACHLLTPKHRRRPHFVGRIEEQAYLSASHFFNRQKLRKDPLELNPAQIRKVRGWPIRPRLWLKLVSESAIQGTGLIA
jgi:hypothetical protein